MHSVSCSPNGENFLSGDDLGVYLWDLEVPDKSFITIDIKPEKIDELNEVITTSIFSPYHDYHIGYGTSKSLVKLADLRENSNATNTGISFKDDVSKNKKNFFTEIITSVSDFKFTPDGNKVVIRDFMTTKVWDMKMPN